METHTHGAGRGPRPRLRSADVAGGSQRPASRPDARGWSVPGARDAHASPRSSPHDRAFPQRSDWAVRRRQAAARCGDGVRPVLLVETVAAAMAVTVATVLAAVTVTVVTVTAVIVVAVVVAAVALVLEAAVRLAVVMEMMAVGTVTLVPVPVPRKTKGPDCALA